MAGRAGAGAGWGARLGPAHAAARHAAHRRAQDADQLESARSEKRGTCSYTARAGGYREHVEMDCIWNRCTALPGLCLRKLHNCFRAQLDTARFIFVSLASQEVAIGRELFAF